MSKFLFQIAITLAMAYGICDGSADPRRVEVPELISNEEQGRYDQLLRLAPSQASSSALCFQAYSGGAAALFDAEVAELWRRTVALGEWRDDPEGQAQEREAIGAQRDALVAKLTQIENVYWACIAAVLTQEQLDLLPGVRIERDGRRLSYLIQLSEHPESRVDLAGLVLANMAQLDPDQARHVNEALARFQAVYVPILKAKESDRRLRVADDAKIMLEMSRLIKLMQTAPDPDMQAEYQALLEKRRSNRLQQLEFSRRMARINRAFIEELASLLPAELMERMRRDYQVSAYPQVYPDSSCLKNWFKHVLEIPSLTQEQREGVMAHEREYGLAKEIVCREMEKRCIDFWELFATGGEFPAGFQDQFKKDLDEIHAERIVLGRKYTKAVVELLTLEQREQLPKAIENRGSSRPMPAAPTLPKP